MIAQQPFQLPKRLAPLTIGICVDQIVEALSLGEIKLGVLEGATREFAGFGQDAALRSFPSASNIAAMTARPPWT